MFVTPVPPEGARGLVTKPETRRIQRGFGEQSTLFCNDFREPTCCGGDHTTGAVDEVIGNNDQKQI